MAYAAPEGTELIELVGAGTMFDVALVREGARVVICKRLVSRVIREPVAHAAFAREVGLLSRARHPVLPELIRAGEDAHGPFALETHIEGASLASGGEFLRARGESIPPKLVAEIAWRAAEALAALHALADAGGPLDIVHGDLAPDHVFRANDEAIAFVDFGAARFRGMVEGGENDRGTLPFVAPEVARGDARLAQAHDVYALAATIVSFATGASLTHGTTDSAMLLEVGERGLASEIVDRVAGLDVRGRDAIRAALAFDPRHRLDSARELAARLRR
jgi:serine/threonine protein kinase